MAKPIEHPDRLRKFQEETSSLKWTGDDLIKSLDNIFVATNDLILAEIEYYYNQRVQTRRTSTVTRAVAWFLGTLGLIAPLLESAFVGTSIVASEFVPANLSKWGYVLLALSASFLTANALFDGSAGHIRNVKAQLDLERIMTMFRFGWYAMLAKMGGVPGSEQLDAAFALLNRAGVDMYTSLGNETAEWTVALKEVVSKYREEQKQVAAGAGSPDG